MERRRAVIVGVRDYSKAEIGDLQYSANDAARLASVLIKHAMFSAKDVALFHDAPAGSCIDAGTPVRLPIRSDILSTITSMATATTSDDMFVFFFAGHGGEISNQPYLFTNDTRMNVINDTAIKVSSLNEVLGSASAKCTVRFFDACRKSMESVRHPLARPMSSGFSDALLDVGAANVVFSACSRGEYAYEHPDLEHGLFSYYLCKGISGLASIECGPVTIESLVHYVKQSVATECERRSHKQTPHFLGNTSGSHILSPNKGKTSVLTSTAVLPGPLEIARSLIREKRSVQHELVAAARVTSHAEEQALLRGVLGRVHNSVAMAFPEDYQVTSTARATLPQRNTEFGRLITRSIESDGLASEGTRLDSSYGFKLNSHHITVPDIELDIDTVRSMLFYRVYYYLNPVATAVHLQAKLSPRPIVDFFTVYPFEVNQSQKLDQVVKGILFRLSDSIACWVTQCGDEVALHLQRENGRGKRAE